MWLRYYIEDKAGVCIIDSIPHCFSKHFSMAVWNTIDDRYSSFVFYIETKPHFLIFASFQSIFTMAVRNTIDEIIQFMYSAETKSHIFIIAISESIFSRTVWNTIDDRFSNFVLPLYRNEATFLDFSLF